MLRLALDEFLSPLVHLARTTPAQFVGFAGEFVFLTRV